MKKNLLVGAASILLLFTVSCQKSITTPVATKNDLATKKVHPTGAILDQQAYLQTPKTDFTDVKKKLNSLTNQQGNVQVLTFTGALPSSVMLNHPAIGDQGADGTCVSWSVGYALLGTLNNEFPLPNVNNPRSPYFVYQVDHSQKSDCSADDGMTVSYGMTILGANGSPDYSLDNALGSPCTPPSSTMYNSAYTDRSYTYSSISSVADIKKALSLRLPVEMGFRVYTSFDDAFNSGTTYTAVTGTYRGNHAVCIIGYDDSKNAFLIQNSWGTFGGDPQNPGCVWLDYGLFTNSTLGIELYMATPSSPLEGQFVRNDNTGQVYIVIDGALRYIPTTATLNGLFKYSDSLLHHFTSTQLANAIYGTTVSQDSGIVQDGLGRVYIREGNTLRYIPSPTVQQFYHINFDHIVFIGTTATYTMLPNL